MKKQLLTLTLCLALTVGSAFAATPAPAKKATTPVKVTATTKKVTAPAKAAATTKKCPAASAVKTPAPEPVLTPEQKAKKDLEEKIAKDRAELYCKLGLSEQQKLTASALEEKTKAEIEPLFAKLHDEKVKLHELKDKKACPCKIAEQKAKVKAVKKDIKKHFVAAQKSFEEMLTADQLAKFKVIKEQRKSERKELMGEHCKCHFPCAPGCPCKCHRHHKPCGCDAAPQGPTAPPAAGCPCAPDKK